MPEALSQVVTSKTKELLAQGINQTETANRIGVSRKSVNRINKNHRKEIESLALNYIKDSIEPIRNIHKAQLSAAQNISQAIQSKDTEELNKIKDTLDIIGITPGELLKIADKKEFRALQVMGVAPSSTPSTVITNIFQQTIKTVIDPAAQKVIDAHGLDLAGGDGDVIDAEYERQYGNE